MIFSRVIERTLSEAEHAQFQKMYIDAMSRLAHIRERMTLASHMKKQKLQKYMREAQEMLQNVRIAAKIQVPAEIAIR